MNTTPLSERYKNIPGKIIPRSDAVFALSNDVVETIHSTSEKSFTAESSETNSRRTWLKIATNDPDRSGDVMKFEGMLHDNFDRNPQFLWQHGLTTEPVHTIGKIVKLYQTSTALYALGEYASEEESPLAEKIFKLDKAGLLPANSIGFKPIEWEPNEFGGFTFIKWELIEVSKVELPCNPFAIDEKSIAAKALTIRDAVELIT